MENGTSRRSRPSRGHADILVWGVLIGLTLIALAVGKSGYTGIEVTGFVLLSTLVKGQLIADFFMGLRRVRLLWRALVAGWLTLVILGIGMAYHISLG